MDAATNSTAGYPKTSPDETRANAETELAALLFGANAKSTPGSPTPFAGTLGFNSVRTSPQLNPMMSEATRQSFTNLAALSGYRTGFVLDSASNSAVQSATASPTGGATFGRRQLLSSMANLNMSQLPPTAGLQQVDQALVDTTNMFGNVTNALAPPGDGMLGTAAASAEFRQRVEEAKSRGLKL
ncbi:hypothetical protein IWW50_006309, partial [Coemansia erecta]